MNVSRERKNELRNHKATLDKIAAGGAVAENCPINFELSSEEDGGGKVVEELEGACPGFWTSLLSAHAGAARALAAEITHTSLRTFAATCLVGNLSIAARFERFRAAHIASALVRGDAFSVYAQILSNIRQYASVASKAATDSSKSAAGEEWAGSSTGSSTGNSTSSASSTAAADAAPSLELLATTLDTVLQAALSLGGVCRDLQAEEQYADALDAMAHSAVLEHAAAATLCLDEALTLQAMAARTEFMASVSMSVMRSVPAGVAEAGMAGSGAAADSLRALVQDVVRDAMHGEKPGPFKEFMRLCLSIIRVRQLYHTLLTGLNLHLGRCDWPPVEPPSRPAVQAPPAAAAAAAAAPGALSAAMEPAAVAVMAPGLRRNQNQAQRQENEPRQQQRQEKEQRQQQLLCQVVSGPAVQLLSMLSFELGRAWEQQLLQEQEQLPGAQPTAGAAGRAQTGLQAAPAAAGGVPDAAATIISNWFNEWTTGNGGAWPWSRNGELAAWGPSVVPAMSRAGHNAVKQLLVVIQEASQVLAFCAAEVPRWCAAAAAADAANGAAGRRQHQHQHQPRQLAPALPYAAQPQYDALQRCLRTTRLALLRHAATEPVEELVRERWWEAMHGLVRLWAQLRPAQAAARLPGLWEQAAGMLPYLPMMLPDKRGQLRVLSELAAVLASPVAPAAHVAAGPSTAPQPVAAAAAATTAEQAAGQSGSATEAAAAAAVSGSSSTTLDTSGCSYSLRCALDAGLLPALEALLRRAMAGLAAVGSSSAVDCSTLLHSSCTASRATLALLCQSGVWPAVLAHAAVEEVVPLVATLARAAAVVADAGTAVAALGEGFGFQMQVRQTVSVCLGLTAMLEQQQQQRATAVAASLGPAAASAGASAAPAVQVPVAAGWSSPCEPLALSRWLQRNLGGGKECDATQAAAPASPAPVSVPASGSVPPPATVSQSSATAGDPGIEGAAAAAAATAAVATGLAPPQQPPQQPPQPPPQPPQQPQQPPPQQPQQPPPQQPQQPLQQQLLADWAAVQWLPLLYRQPVLTLMSNALSDTAYLEPLRFGRSGALLVSRLSRSLVALSRHYVAAVWRYRCHCIEVDLVSGLAEGERRLEAWKEEVIQRALQLEAAHEGRLRRLVQLEELACGVQARLSAAQEEGKEEERAAAKREEEALGAEYLALGQQSQRFSIESGAVERQLAQIQEAEARLDKQHPIMLAALRWRTQASELQIVDVESALCCAAHQFVAATLLLEATPLDSTAAGGSGTPVAAAGGSAGAGAVAGGGGGGESVGRDPAAAAAAVQAAHHGWDPEATADAAALATAVMDLAEVVAVHSWFDSCIPRRGEGPLLDPVLLLDKKRMSETELLKWLQRFGLRQRPRLEAVLWAPYREQEAPAAAASGSAAPAAAASAAAASGSAASETKAQQRSGGQQPAVAAAKEEAAAAAAAAAKREAREAREAAILALLDELVERYGLADPSMDPTLDDTGPASALVQDPTALAQRLLSASGPGRADSAGAATQAGGTAWASGSTAGARDGADASSGGSGGSGSTDKPPAPAVPGHVLGVGLCCNLACRNLDGPSALLPPGAGKVCARCKAVRYCCGVCQLEDWRQGGHEKRCMGVRKRLEAAVAESASYAATGTSDK